MSVVVPPATGHSKANFESLVPAMELDLVRERGEAGVDGVSGAEDEAPAAFRIRSRAPEGSGREAGAWRRGLLELSGGQRTLLNISTLLACGVRDEASPAFRPAYSAGQTPR